MATVDVDDETEARLLFAAAIAGVTVGEVVRRLVVDHPDNASSTGGKGGEHRTRGVEPTMSITTTTRHRPIIKIFCRYLGQRTDAEYFPGSGAVTIRSGPLAGSFHESLTAAAKAVVGEANPGRESPNTNGRLFWRDDETGEPIRSILGKR